MAKLDHENVVSVYFSGEAAGHHFFAMQYIQGESLAQRLERCPRLPVDAALDVIEQTLAGLQPCMPTGLIHRDVKPANILIESGTERVVLADFGVARAVGEGYADHRRRHRPRHRRLHRPGAGSRGGRRPPGGPILGRRALVSAAGRATSVRGGYACGRDLPARP